MTGYTPALSTKILIAISLGLTYVFAIHTSPTFPPLTPHSQQPHPRLRPTSDLPPSFFPQNRPVFRYRSQLDHLPPRQPAGEPKNIFLNLEGKESVQFVGSRHLEAMHSGSFRRWCGTWFMSSVPRHLFTYIVISYSYSILLTFAFATSQYIISRNYIHHP